MALYEFSPEDAQRWADGQLGEKRIKGDQLEFQTCPYCKSRKDRWTFAISLRTGQFECKRASCRQKGNMLTIARDFEFSLSNDTDRYFGLNDYRGKFRSFTDKHRESTDRAIEYLGRRGISEAVCKKYEITTKDGNDSVLVFPFKDKAGLKFIKYRNLDFAKGKGSKEWCEANCMPILFGMNHCEGNERLVITEGQIDSLSLAEAGIQNAVSVPTGCNGFTWIPHVWDWFIEFKEIVIFGDNENGHITLVDELSRRFPNTVKVVQNDDYKGCKDANEILLKYGAEALKVAVENARTIPLYYLKPLESVKKVRLEDLQYIATGIDCIDQALSGGIHEGELMILSGKRGGGKSTLASQVLCSVTNQEYKSFVYSGELPDFMFKMWFDMQFSGDGCATDYDGKIFLFDNNVIQDDDHVSILQAVEESIKRYDVKFILLDNLMTIIDAESSERLYRAQSSFVGNLSHIAKKYNVCIVLVVHPRKMASLDLNDDVAGAAEITNKADIVMTYSQNKDLMPDERYLTISKNRLTGKLLTNQVLYYDEKTKRISDKANQFNWIYGLQKLKSAHDGFSDAEETEDFPF